MNRGEWIAPATKTQYDLLKRFCGGKKDYNMRSTRWDVAEETPQLIIKTDRKWVTFLFVVSDLARTRMEGQARQLEAGGHGTPTSRVYPTSMY